MSRFTWAERHSSRWRPAATGPSRRGGSRGVDRFPSARSGWRCSSSGRSQRPFTRAHVDDGKSSRERQATPRAGSAAHRGGRAFFLKDSAALFAEDEEFRRVARVLWPCASNFADLGKLESAGWRKIDSSGAMRENRSQKAPEFGMAPRGKV